MFLYLSNESNNGVWGSTMGDSYQSQQQKECNSAAANEDRPVYRCCGQRVWQKEGPSPTKGKGRLQILLACTADHVLIIMNLWLVCAATAHGQRSVCTAASKEG